MASHVLPLPAVAAGLYRLSPQPEAFLKLASQLSGRDSEGGSNSPSIKEINARQRDDLLLDASGRYVFALFFEEKRN